MRFTQSVTILFYVLLLGAGLLSFFVILSGGRQTGVLRNFYWLEADTSGFSNAPATTRWFNYDWCGFSNGDLSNCSSTQAAKPFSPRDNFGASNSMPAEFVDHRKTYYYLSRVAWAMLLVGIFYIVCALVPVAITIFSTSLLASFFAVLALWLAWFFVTLAACLYTGCYVKARNAFSDNNRRAKLGDKNFAFIWTSVALLLACAIWSSVAGAFFGVEKYRNSRHGHHHQGLESGISSDTYGGDKTTLDTTENNAPKRNRVKVFHTWKYRSNRGAQEDSLGVNPQLTTSEYDNEGNQVVH
ncbi:LANO_0H04192g1_1 [Lachancea nothofagi CBS 11611]|uniref:LANO_0H04192g1_1 n=1 Tax=Lachancea nothofagi CBS 11611 TaxID=1266666 RepID=A0A1G4KLC7_9SACH|nr:LANO_0H04192g1_1 [Lachancea nothofagi CBS 11611]